MSRPSSPIQPIDPVARPRWEHSPASASASVSLSVSAGPSPSKTTTINRTEPVDTVDLTTTKGEVDVGTEKMVETGVEKEEWAERVEKSAEETHQDKDVQIITEDGPTTKDSEMKVTPPSSREKSIGRETDVQVDNTKPEQDGEEKTQQQRHASGPPMSGTTTGNPSVDIMGSSATPTTATTANQPAANSTTTTTTTAGNNLLPAVLHRPPIRPVVTGVSKSKFDLELNPFEQSFSRSSTSIHKHNGNPQHTGSSSGDVRIAYGDWNNTRGRAESAAGAAAVGGDKRKRSEEDGGDDDADDDDDERNNLLHPKMSLSGSSSPNDKTVLPPLSALTSPVPVDPASHFSWAGISSFLRTGPLSPAMLNGPTSTSGNNTHHGHHHSVGGHSVPGMTPGGGFDPSTFRTGFTPGGILAGGVGGASGGGSGFTPGYAGLLTGGGGFPMPSPNTAAFLSMVTHGTPGPGTPTGIGRLGGIGGVPDMQNGGKMMLSRPTTAGAGGMNGAGTTIEDMNGRGGMNGDTRRSSDDDDSGAAGSIHSMRQSGQQQQQQQQQQVAMTPNSLNMLTGVVSRMNSANTDEEGMYSASSAGNRQQNTLAHQQSHIGPNETNPAHNRLPPPPPHPDHPMHNATDYFVNATGVQPGGMMGPNGAGVPSHMHAPHPGFVGGSHLSHQHPQHPHQQQQQQHQQQPMSLPPAHLHASSADPRAGVPGAGYPMHHAAGATMANVNPQGAGVVGPGGPLNGLFLLSQAHQELGKREEAQRVAGVAPVIDAVANGADTTRRAVSGGTATGGRKRKSEDTGKPAAGGRGASKRGKKNGSIGTQHDQSSQQNGINLPAYQGQTILQQSQALLAQGLQAQAERDAMQEPDDDEDQKMMDMSKDGGADGGDGMGKKDGKPETEEEKRKNFLERNRQAALKCRQRKKAWLTQLQTKVDGLTEENERLKAMLTSITDEAQKLSAVLSSHRDCPGMASSMAQLGLVLPPPLPGHMVQQQRQMSVVPTFVPPQPH
ncbi:hypothetical protein QFC21_000792 [Naganishia friedmannii]|uniref:Uncharacterized protein n=1 Tax=Naganishia friedmannii TaxID=89922 RepID=A0ACC2W9P9_9TREE|nr:hypothetical protein QFC21_000792 [Naganishia friedmannii]